MEENSNFKNQIIEAFLYILSFAILLLIASIFLIAPYVKNKPEIVAKTLEERFIYAPVTILQENGNYDYYLHLYSYNETKEITRYGIVQSHTLLNGKKIDPREIKEGEEILDGFYLLENHNVLTFGGYNPGIAKTAIITILNKDKKPIWKREVDLPLSDTFLVTKKIPFEYAGFKSKITYLDAERNDVTDKIKKINNVNK